MSKKITKLELRACLWERSDYISHLEFVILQRRFGYPEPPPYVMMPKEFYIEQVKGLEVKDDKDKR